MLLVPPQRLVDLLKGFAIALRLLAAALAQLAAVADLLVDARDLRAQGVIIALDLVEPVAVLGMLSAQRLGFVLESPLAGQLGFQGGITLAHLLCQRLALGIQGL